MTREEAFALWSDKHDLADGLPWEMDSNVARTIFNAGWDAKTEAAKQTDMFPVATEEGQDVSTVTAADIYDAYPRHESRGDAIKAIQKTMKVVPPDKLMAIVKQYAAAVREWPQTARFTVDGRSLIPLCGTWMNKERWRDDPAVWKRGVAAVPSQFGRTYQ